MTLEPLHELIIRLIEETNRPIFLTGKAGTGKTTFLHYIKSHITKNHAIVAPTAVAAINAGGVTLHSFFQIPFGPIMPLGPGKSNDSFSTKQISQEKLKLLQCLDLLIIDEISMVRADTIDYIDSVLRHVKGSVRPFGGVQLLMVGDLYQLPPVYQNDWHVLSKFYTGPYFFDSLVINKCALLTFELTQVYRQKDPQFIEILNSIRNGHVAAELLARLNKHYNPTLNANWLENYVTLSTHNKLVKETNELRLSELDTLSQSFKATITGDFPKESYPAEEELILKVGAQVMFIKNDTSGRKQYYNGRTGKIISINEGSIKLRFLDNGSEFEVNTETWQNIKYTLTESAQKVSEFNSGSFTQYPLRLAWAITIHKSQGLTFDKAIIDVDAAFAHGQSYVALSRCRNLEGLILKQPVKSENIMTDPLVINFMKKAQSHIQDELLLEKSVAGFEIETIEDVFDFSILSGAWYYLISTMTSEEDIQLPIKSAIHTAEDLINDKIKKIGDQFKKKELANVSKENGAWRSDTLITRLKDARDFFLPNLIAFQEETNKINSAAMTTELPTVYYYAFNYLMVNLNAKIAAFTRLQMTTFAADLLVVMKTAKIEYRPINKNWKPKMPVKEISNHQLFDQLILWRKGISNERNVPDYTILSEKVIREIAAKLPRSLNQLSQIKNFGEEKIADLGTQILTIIRGFLGENELFS